MEDSNNPGGSSDIQPNITSSHLGITISEAWKRVEPHHDLDINARQNLKQDSFGHTTIPNNKSAGDTVVQVVNLEKPFIISYDTTSLRKSISKLVLFFELYM